jgi:phosphocarrier protein
VINQQLTLKNKLGLHARASAKLVSLASRFASRIEIKKSMKIANAKSIMNVMLLGAAFGDFLEFFIDGEDETSAFSAIEKLINDKFGEFE